MSAHPLTNEQLSEALRALRQAGGNSTRAADALRLNRSAFRHRVAEARRRGLDTDFTAGTLPVDSESDPAPTEERERLLFRIQQLETELLLARKDAMTTAAVRYEIFRLKEACATPHAPAWASDARSKRSSGMLAPMTIWSDWHWGEVVEPGEVNGANEYNLSIARERAERITRGIIDLAMNHTVHGNFPGIVVTLGGDMVSGDIHDELSKTNDKPIMPVVVDLFSTLIRCLNALKDTFGRVFIPCVAGNHGRTTTKPNFKRAAYLSYDWLLYALLEKHFEDDEAFEFLVPDGTDAHFRVWGKKYLATHGDKLGTAGGDGIIGAIGPIMRGLVKTRNSNSSIGLDFDTMLIGHYHQYLPLPRAVVNGSLVGHNEYAHGKLRAAPERPQQGFWFDDPHNGTVFHMPVFAEASKPADVEHDWLRWTNKPKRRD